MAGSPEKALSFEELVTRRAQTERVSNFLAKRLRGHLAVLYPLLAPKRIFGKHLGAREDVPRADEAMAQLTEKYKEVCGRPFDLRGDLDTEALSNMEMGVEIYPWEYRHQIAGREDTELTIASPVRWVLTYKSDYTLAQVRNLIASKSERRGGALRHFVVNAVAIQVVLGRVQGFLQLLEDLRYTVRIETDALLGKLPLVLISSAVPSFRPDDEIILAATRFSGVPSFIELIDEEGARALDDLFRKQIEAVVR
jgi:hypothetical protein